MESPSIILEQEKLVLHSSYSIPELLSILETSESKTRLEFHGITFNEHTISIWLNYASIIKSIDFFDCVFDDANIAVIINYCLVLIRIGWHYEKLSPSGKPFCSDDVLKNLVSSGIVRSTVNSLTIRLNDINWISASTLPFLFSIYKDLKEFSINFEKSDVDISATAEVEPTSFLTSYSILDQLISIKDIISAVNLKLPSIQIYQGFTCKFTKPLHEYLRLNSNDRCNTIHEHTYDNLIEFCTERKNLESVHCTVNTETIEGVLDKEIFAARFLKDILKECPKVRELKLNIDPSYNDVVINLELFETILESDLEVLQLSCEEMKMDNDLLVRASLDTFKKNSRLSSLSLKINNQDTMILFLKCFNHLTHLEVYNAEDDVLQAIWRYQENLTSLQLLNVVPYTWAFTGCASEDDEDYRPEQNTGVAINRLQDLQYLNIEAIEPDWNATDSIFDYFVFPKLRFLDLKIMDDSGITRSMMTAIERNLSHVEGIILQYYNEVPYVVWTELCSRMKSLRYLAIMDDSMLSRNFTSSEYENLFNICQTLRVLVHKHSGGRDVFYYNVVQKKVLKKGSSHIYEERNTFGEFAVKNIQV